MTRSIWTKADEPPPGRTRRLSQPSASPDHSLAAAGPGRESRWGLSLLGVTEPKCFASSLRQQPGSSPGLLGKGFLACVRQPPCCPLRTGHGSPTVSGCGDPGGHTTVSSVQTTHRLPVCPRKGGPVLHSLALSANTSRFLTKRQRPALRVRDDRAPHRVPRTLSALPQHRRAVALTVPLLFSCGQTLAPRYSPFHVDVTRLGKHPRSGTGCGLISSVPGREVPLLPPALWFSPEDAIPAEDGEVAAFQGSTLLAALSLFVFDGELSLVPVFVLMRK